MPADQYYQIIRQKRFDTQFNKIAKAYKRIDELESAIDWALARNPSRFPKIVGNLYLWKTDEIAGGFPQLRIAYLVDETEMIVYLLQVEEIKK